MRQQRPRERERDEKERGRTKEIGRLTERQKVSDDGEEEKTL